MTTISTIGCQTAPYQAGHTSVGQVVTVPIDSLHPTQAVVGEREVDRKQDKINGMDDAELQAYIEKKTAPVVIGPDDKLYMIDHHHTLLALLKSGRSSTCQARIIANLSNEDPSAFWDEMERRHWVYLKDAQGQPITPVQLPGHLQGMTNDPYRALAGEVRDRDGFDKTDTPFAEFKWANYFRSRVSIGQDDTDWNRAATQATAIAQDPAAKDLPGFVGR